MPRSLLAVLTVLGLLLGSAAAPASAATGAEWNRFLASALRRTALTAGLTPPSSWAVLDGASTAAGGIGGASAASPFVLGSLSKGITAVAVLQLSDDGHLDLQAPAAGYLSAPERAGLPGGGASPVTVEQLLTHTSGLRDDAPPGDTGFAYANRNYEVLGTLVAEVSGRSFAAQVQERIFGPLGMTSSSAEPGAAERAQSGHYLAFGIPLPARTDRSASVPAGAIVSTAGDYARLLRMLLDGGTGAPGVRVLGATSAAAMLTAHTQTPNGAVAPGTDGYGYGWAVGTGDDRVAAHVGRAEASFAEVVLRPDHRQAAVVFQAADSWFYDQQSPAAAALAALRAGGPGGVDPSSSGRSGTTTATILAAVWVLALGLFAGSCLLRRRRDRDRTDRGGTDRGTAPSGVRTVVRCGLDLAVAAGLCALWFAGAGMLLLGRPLDLRLAPAASLEITALVLLLAVLLAGRAALGGGAVVRRRRSADHAASSS